MRRYSVVALVTLSSALAACSDVGDSVRGALARDDATDGTRDRVEQQLGDAPTMLDTTAAARLSGAFRGAAARALPAVVRITTIAVSEVPAGFLPGMENPEIGQQRMLGSGSGFIIDKSGLILTNHHVVRDAVDVTVNLLDGREFQAQVIGTDPSTDIAVIRVDAGTQTLPVSELGDSDAVRVGDWVIALGNPMGLTFTATAGIVSAKNRSIGILEGVAPNPLEAFIQTDAAINPGNSGGPLVDLNGRVIGINTAIATDSETGTFAGAGFAIPISLARKIADDIVQYGVPHRPRLGVQIADVNAADAAVYKLEAVTGVEVTGVTRGMPAERAGLVMGDVILTLNGAPVSTLAELQAKVAQFKPGDRVDVGFSRYGRRMQAAVQLGEFEVERAERAPRREERDPNPLGFRVRVLPANLQQQTSLRGNDIPVVTAIDPLGSAASSGLEPGHVIRKFNGRDIRTVRDLERAAAGVRRGELITLIIVDIRDADLTPTIVNYRAQ
jgi:serine protease Do